MRNKTKFFLIISLIILLISVNIPSISGENSIITFNNLQYNQDSSKKDMFFNIKIRLTMKLAHMQSLSACIIKNNSIVWYDSYGFSNRLFLQKPSKDTNYMVASISKVITATALMQLYENESYDFELDDNVNKFLPFDLKNPKFPDVNITIRMLLAHQSSLHDHDKISHLRYFISYRAISYIREILLPNGSDYHPEFWGDYPPGDGANYSNMGYILLGYIIERMTNQSFEQYCQENIFEPLEMKNSSFNLSKLDKSNLAVPYVWFGGFYFRIPKTDYTFYDPFGGMYTTVEDLSHLFIAHLNNGVYNNNRILQSSTINLMHQIQYPDSSPYYNTYRFGLGWAIWFNENDEPYKHGHNGDLVCYHARMQSRLYDNTSIIFFYNSGASPRLLFPRISLELMRSAVRKVENLLFQKADEL